MEFTSEFLIEFNERFAEFRKIELDVHENYSESMSTKSFALLKEIELCFASKAYVACMVLSVVAIEASLRHRFGENGELHKKIEKSGYKDEINWLRLLRNDLVHDVNHEHIENTYFVEEIEQEEKLEAELKEFCIKAFKLMHTIHLAPCKL